MVWEKRSATWRQCIGWSSNSVGPNNPRLGSRKRQRILTSGARSQLCPWRHAVLKIHEIRSSCIIGPTSVGWSHAICPTKRQFSVKYVWIPIDARSDRQIRARRSVHRTPSLPHHQIRSFVSYHRIIFIRQPSSHPTPRLDLELGRSMTKGFAELFSSHLFVKIAALALTAIVSFYLGRRWSDSYPQLIFFTSGGASDRLTSPSVAVSPNANLTLDVSALTSNATLLPGDADAPPPLDADLPSPSPSPPPEARKVGIVDANGTMSVGFDVGEFDPDVADGWDDGGPGFNETAGMRSGEGERRVRVKIDKFKVCPQEMREWIPCMDN
ncbi:hypothetical protein GW17_00045547, partial [Ensete ventricosum]